MAARRPRSPSPPQAADTGSKKKVATLPLSMHDSGVKLLKQKIDEFEELADTSNSKLPQRADIISHTVSPVVACGTLVFFGGRVRPTGDGMIMIREVCRCSGEWRRDTHPELSPIEAFRQGRRNVMPPGLLPGTAGLKRFFIADINVQMKTDPEQCVSGGRGCYGVDGAMECGAELSEGEGVSWGAFTVAYTVYAVE